MQSPEPKTCPRCSRLFDCSAGNIKQCQCYGVELEAHVKKIVEERYNDCLCRECLQQLQQQEDSLRIQINE